MLVDFHSHIYKNYNLELVLRRLVDLNQSESKVVFLTERIDCDFYPQIKEFCNQHSTLKITHEDQESLQINSNLNLIPGRQYVSKDGIEILSIFSCIRIEDKKDNLEYCQSIIDNGGLVAFSWAFGKWIGRRGDIILNLCQQLGRSNCIILDSRLRPSVFGLPKQIKELKKQGFKFLAGSDPLPLSHHQDKLLSFGVKFNDFDNKENLKQFIKHQIKNNDSFDFFGTRSSICEFTRDQILLRMS